MDVTDSTEQFLNINVHGVFGFFTFIDLLVNHIEFRRNHIAAIIATSTAYLFVNALATHLRGKPVHDPVDYKSFMTVAFVFVAMLLAIGAFYLGFYFFVKCKKPGKAKKDRPRIHLNV